MTARSARAQSRPPLLQRSPWRGVSPCIVPSDAPMISDTLAGRRETEERLALLRAENIDDMVLEDLQFIACYGTQEDIEAADEALDARVWPSGK